MRRAVWIPLVVVVLAIAGVAALVAWLATSEGAVVWLASRVAAAAGGSLEIVQPRGSFGGTVRIGRLRYEDADFRVTASDVAVEPALVAVLTRRAVLRNLTARELEILVKPTFAKLSASLALPLGVSVERLAIDRVVLRVDPEGLEFTAVSLAYEFAEGTHAVRGLRATMLGALAGSGSLGAAPPFPATATVSLARGDANVPLRVGAKLGGTLAQLELALDGEIAKASVDGSARIAPFAARWLEDAAARVTDLDLALVDASLPRTRIALDLQAASRDDGAVAGNLAARNAAPGPLTDNRMPLVAAASPFAWRDGALTLDKLAADLGPGGRAAGAARVARGQATLDLAVNRLDLRALHRPLRATRLDGTIAASLSESVQEVRAKLAQGRLRFEVEGARKGDAFTVKRLVAAAGGGTLTGEGVVGLAGPRRFDARAKLAEFDPAAFGEYPAARINADIAAKGELEPHWRVEAQLDVRDSRWRAAPLSGG